MDVGPSEVLLSAEGSREILSSSEVSVEIGSGWRGSVMIGPPSLGRWVVGSRGIRVEVALSVLVVEAVVAEGREKKDGRPSRFRRRLGDVPSLLLLFIVNELKRGAILKTKKK